MGLVDPEVENPGKNTGGVLTADWSKSFLGCPEFDPFPSLVNNQLVSLKPVVAKSWVCET